MNIAMQDVSNKIYVLQVWLYVVSGLVWTTLNVATSVLINSFMVSTINLTVDEAATGVTLIGIVFSIMCYILTILSI